MAQKYDEMNLNYKRTTTQEKGWSSESWDEFDKCDGNEICYAMRMILSCSMRNGER